jgi:hypothetical protein
MMPSHLILISTPNFARKFCFPRRKTWKTSYALIEFEFTPAKTFTAGFQISTINKKLQSLGLRCGSSEAQS